MRRLLPTVLALSGCTLITSTDLDSIKRSRDAGGTPSLVADRSSLDFGSVPKGSPAPPEAWHLTNVGTGPAGDFSADLTGAGQAVFATSDVKACSGLMPGASCTLTLTFTPADALTYSAMLSVSSPGAGTVTLALSGAGVVPGALTVSPAFVDFGSVVQAGNSATATFTVKNTGSAPSGMLMTALTGSDQLQFELVSDGCADQVLMPSGECTLGARFAPGLPGARRATLTVSGAPGGTAVATLDGLGLSSGKLGISPSSRMFGSVPAGSQGQLLMFQVTNTGDAATGPVALTLSGGGAPDFQVLTTDCAGAVLQPTTSCSAQVRFAPATAGFKVATLVASASPGGNATAALSGTAQEPATLKSNPPMYDYGTVIIGAPADATFTLSNPGAVATGPLTPVLSGADAADFSIVSGCTGALTPGATCDLVVRFGPSASGARSASLVVSATPGASVTVPLTGNGAAPGQLDITPKMHPYGMVVVGASSNAFTYTVTNNGGSATSMLAARLTGTNMADFMVDGDGCTGMALAPQGSCDVAVRFTPMNNGTRSASLSVSATMGGATAATLTGVALAQVQLDLGPTFYNFGAWVLGTQGSTKTFDVNNLGGVPTMSPLSVGLSGGGAGSYSVTGNSCSTSPLSEGGTCMVTVQFLPSGDAGTKPASLDVQPMSGPGLPVSATLTGTALVPSALAFDSQAFGAALIDAGTSRTFTLTNTGGGASGAVSLSIGGGDVGDFTLVAPKGTDCVSGVTTLGGGASCTVSVDWVAHGRGARSSTLTATATPGGTAPAALNGTGLLQATLSSAMSMAPLGTREIGDAGAPFMWSISNSGDLPTGMPSFSVTGANPGDFSVDAGCKAVLTPAGQCTMAVTFRPTGAGGRNATVSVAAAPGGQVDLAASGTGLARLTVVRTDGGTVTSSPAGLTCGATCSGLFDFGTVTLTAATANGSGSYFSGWSGGGCTGPGRTCDVTTDVSKTVTATFSPITNNLVFVSSLPNVSRKLGALTNYDSLCNLMASDAGINSATNNAYLAWISNSTTTARTRFAASVRGFVRLDGKPLFDQLTEPFVPTYKLYNPLTQDEHGVDVGPSLVLTGSQTDNTTQPVNELCNNWSTQDAGVAFGFGQTGTGPGNWTYSNVASCDQPARLYCFMNQKTAALTPGVSPGKKIWVTSDAHIPSVGVSPHAHCQSKKPGSVATARALIAMTTDAGSSVLNPAQTYVRLDGQVVGTYADLSATGDLKSGFWQDETGAYLTGVDVWTGAEGLVSEPGVLMSSCNNWTTNTGSGSPFGWTGTTVTVYSPSWWQSANLGCDDLGPHLICVEQ